MSFRSHECTAPTELLVLRTLTPWKFHSQQLLLLGTFAVTVCSWNFYSSSCGHFFCVTSNYVIFCVFSQPNMQDKNQSHFLTTLEENIWNCKHVRIHQMPISFARNTVPESESSWYWCFDILNILKYCLLFRYRYIVVPKFLLRKGHFLVLTSRQ